MVISLANWYDYLEEIIIHRFNYLFCT